MKKKYLNLYINIVHLNSNVLLFSKDIFIGDMPIGEDMFD